MKELKFEIYRYQILPRDRYFQGVLFGGIKSIEDLLDRKNAILYERIKEIKVFSGPKTEVIGEMLYSQEDFFLFRFAANRSVRIETKEFTEKEIENWPSFWVGIWNDPSKQLIAVQERREAFQSTESVINAIVSTLNKHLGREQLRVHAEPLFREEEFWKIVDRYQGKIKEISFELITPNLANISGALSDELKEFAVRTNTSRTKVDITSDPDSSLNVARNDLQIEGLVRYASEGGGNISLKAHGIRRSVQTSRTKKSFEIGDIEISGLTPGEISDMMKQFLS